MFGAGKIQHKDSFYKDCPEEVLVCVKLARYQLGPVKKLGMGYKCGTTNEVMQNQLGRNGKIINSEGY